MAIIPIDDSEIVAARALRRELVRFWSTAQGDLRSVYDRFIALTPIADGVVSRDALGDPGPGWWCEPADAEPGRAILYIHGGGYGLGHARAYLGLASQLATRARTRVFVLEYPLAPEAQLPVALELALATLARLKSGFESVALVGDSAGAGLSCATATAALRQGIAVAALVGFSPWTDLSLSGASVRQLAVSDPLLDVGYLRNAAAAYLGSVPATDPRASPLFDAQLPPTLLQVGSDEVLLDDSRRLAEALAAAGTEVVLEEWQGMHHVFVLNTRELASARRALDNAAKFLDQHLSR
jgi:monoterpene epsilon-lactone hydrolase